MTALLRGSAKRAICPGRWDIDRDGPLGWPADQRRLTSFRVADFRLVFVACAGPGVGSRHMGLATDLDYHHGSANPLHRVVRWWAGTRAGAWTFSRSLRHLDDLVGRLSRGRHSAPGLLAGLAVLDLTTTGRKSGRPRTSHLIATPYADTLALVGTNFGQPGTPAWVVNLEADPRATVTYRGASRAVVARPADPGEVEEVFAATADVYSGYQRYRRRIDGRRVRVFVLSDADEPSDEASDGPA